MTDHGFCDWTTTFGEDNYKVVKDRVAEKYLQHYDLDAYVTILPTHEGCLKGAKHFDIPPFPEPKLWREAEKRTIQYLERYIEKCEKRDVISLPTDTSPGPSWKRAGFKTKGQVLTYCAAYIGEYLAMTPEERPRPLWSVSPKIEPLKRSKILANDPRVFIIPPPEYLIHTGQYTEDFDDQLKRIAEQDPRFPIRVGGPVQYGGLTDVFRDLKGTGHKKFFAGDLEKYDKRIWEWMAQTAMRIRIHFLKKSGNWTDRDEEELKWNYHEFTHSMMLLSNGQIVEKHVGLPSGDFRTSTDGSLIHLVEKFMELIIYELENGLKNLDLDDYVNVKLYSDDHMGSADADIDMSFERRKWLFKQVGWIISADKDVVSDTLDGIPFLGMTYRTLPDGTPGLFPNATKVACNIVNLLSYVEAEGELLRDRLSSYRKLAAFDDDLWIAIDRICKEYSSKIWFRPGDLWSRSACKSLWLGLERGGSR